MFRAQGNRTTESYRIGTASLSPVGTILFSKGISWFEAKTNIIRDAVRAYLAKPIYNLNPTA